MDFYESDESDEGDMVDESETDDDEEEEEDDASSYITISESDVMNSLTSEDEDERISAAYDVAHMCEYQPDPNEFPLWEKAQQKLAALGAGSALLKLVQEGSSQEAKCAGFNAISQFCSRNEANSTTIGTDPIFQIAIRQAMTENDIESESWALVAMCNVLMNSFDSHPNLLCLLPNLRQSLIKHKHEPIPLVNEICITLYNFSLNESSRPFLVSEGIISEFVVALREWISIDSHINQSIAVVTMAIANCTKDIQNDNILVSFTDKDIYLLVQLVSECFKASVDGRDYPPGSRVYFMKWELSMAVTNLAKSVPHRKLLLQFHVLDMVKQILDEDGKGNKKEQQLQSKWGLNALWQLCYQSN